MRTGARIAVTFAVVGLAACGADGPPETSALDPIAQRYVSLALSLGEIDKNYVDAYYGPDSLRAAAKAANRSIESIRLSADSLVQQLDTLPAEPDALVSMRHRYLRQQLSAMSARTRMLGGEKFAFDDEARALYDMSPPHFDDAHFDSLLTQLDSLLKGPEPLAARYQAFRDKITVPPQLVDTVFRRAIAACRARTVAHIPLPPGESFEVQYVKGNSWSAYNWYKGNYHSLIQVSLDLPITIDRMIDLACHEGYPGHHVFNASIEQRLVRGKGWVEYSVYPLFSPQSAIAEGSGNYGIEMAFPGEERTAFERDSLYPLARLDPALAPVEGAVVHVVERLNYARNEVARRFLAGKLDEKGAQAAMSRYWLLSPASAAKSLRFIKDYRSYVVNYNVGRDLVGNWVERSGIHPAVRWQAFARLLSVPSIPRDLQPPRQ